jgi:PAS domain S-box-containing protein
MSLQGGRISTPQMGRAPAVGRAAGPAAAPTGTERMVGAVRSWWGARRRGADSSGSQMDRDPTPLWHSIMQCLLGGTAIAAVTFVCLQLGLNFATTAFVYLIIVVLISLLGGFIASVVLSVMAVGCLNWFFAPHVFNYRGGYPFDIVAVVAFLTTSLVVTGLMQAARRQAAAARRAEEKIRQDQRELRQLIDVVPKHIFVMGPDGSPLSANEVWLSYTGLTQADVLREDYRARLHHPDDLERIGIERDRAIASGVEWSSEARLRRKDGKYFWFLIQANPMRDESGRIIRWYGSATDIDDRKQAEEALREQASLLDLTHDSVFVRDVNDVITYWNRGAEELYGWKREEAIGKVSHQLMQTVFPEPLEQIVAELCRAGRWEGELVHRRRDGTKVTVASRWSVRRGEDGQPLATLETHNDITERRRTEEDLQQVQAELAHVTRVTTLGELAASIAHEVNQPLTGIVTNGAAGLRWLDQAPPLLHEARSSIEDMVSDAQRASGVIQRIRTLSKKSVSEKAAIDINDVIGEVVLLVRREVLGHGIVLRLDLAAGLPPVFGDRVQLQQVVINLVMNAIEAMASVEDRRHELVIRTQQDAAEGIVVAVVDSGTGIDPQQASRLFNAFFTTKPDGMGMGLSICRSIVEAHGGRLSASPNKSVGATFRFVLPPHGEELDSRRGTIFYGLSSTGKTGGE